MAARSGDLYRPKTSFDLLRVPVIGKLLRRRYGRLILQIPLIAVAVLVISCGVWPLT